MLAACGVRAGGETDGGSAHQLRSRWLGSRHWIERWAARTPPDAVIANSRFTAKSVRAVFPVAPIEVCYPVRKPDLDDPEVIRRAVREELGVPLDSTVILQASRLERWKGQDVLIRALPSCGTFLTGMPGLLVGHRRRVRRSS